MTAHEDWEDACDLPVDEWPTQMGRWSVGPPIGVFFSEDANRALIAIAEPFGTRHRSGVIRVAIRRLLTDQAGLPSLVEERARNSVTRPRFPVQMNMHLDEETAHHLADLARRLGANRGELIRIAVDLFLVDLAQLRLAGTPFDIEAALTDELFQGEASRDRLIRRGRRRQAERLRSGEKPGSGRWS
ncbi:ribbon-helix-helix domain-containing protein [Rhodococcus sp. ACT016]|uniref:ribbon-helix-helix domain-containing protein n=1 Tax=Rhodococcus sp. ACT016 TaxID=3134808 RepID=UPI003D2CA12F